MKIYIIGEKRTEEEYEKLESILKKEGHEIINILNVLKQLPKMIKGEKIAKILVEESDAVFVKKGWKRSDMSKAEVMYAVSQDINVTFEDKEELPFM